MNYWPRWIGSIQKKTSHLSLMEMGAYDRLLDSYYANEAPLPGDVDRCCRIAGASTKDERKAVAAVLAEFFKLTDGGYMNERAAEELAEAKPKIEAAKANGKKGGRPKGAKNKNPTETQWVPENNPGETQSESSTSTDISTSLRSVESASRLPKPFALPDEWATWAKAKRPDLDPVNVGERFADFWHAVPGAKGKKTDWPATWRNWVRNEHAPRKAAAGPSEPAWVAERKDRMAQFAGSAAAKPKQTFEVIDGTTRVLG